MRIQQEVLNRLIIDNNRPFKLHFEIIKGRYLRQHRGEGILDLKDMADWIVEQMVFKFKYRTKQWKVNL